jgi:hypothetical protein
MINDEEVMSAGTQGTCRKISKMATLATSFFMIHNGGPQDYIHSQKTLGHIHNYHTLLTQANSSYEYYELKIED